MWFGQKLYRIDGREVLGRWQPFDTEQAAIKAGCDFVTVLELACTVADYHAWCRQQEIHGREGKPARFQAPFRGPFYADFDTQVRLDPNGSLDNQVRFDAHDPLDAQVRLNIPGPLNNLGPLDTHGSLDTQGSRDNQLRLDTHGSLDHLRLDLADRLAKIAERYHLDPNQFQLWYTGGRGFHWILPATHFSDPDFQHPHLPRIYRRLAERLGLMHPTTHHPDGLADRAVYSAGRGRMWRKEGQRRPNHQAKIPITFKDLQHRTAEELIEQSKQPHQSNRTNVATMSPTQNPALARLFEEIIAEIESESKRQLPRRSKPINNPKGRARTHQPECQDWQQIQQTLDRLPPATADHYDTWLRIGMILHDASGGSDQGLHQWTTWSSQSPKFNRDTCTRKWASFRSGLIGGLTIRTLYHLVGDGMCGI